MSRIRRWLVVACLLSTWFTCVFAQTSIASVCELEPCACSRGKLECDCSTSAVKHMTLKPELFDSLSLSSIKVQNCRGLHVRSRTLAGLPALQQISIANITTLTLEEESFSYPGEKPQLLVNITDCHIPEIPSYCFQGQLRDVLMNHVRVPRIRAYAFSSVEHLDKLAFTGVHVDLLEPQAFKKFTVDLLSIVNTNLSLVSQRAMTDVEVLQEVRLERLKSDRIEAYAFNILSPRSFKIVQSSFKHVEQKAFNAQTKGDVSIHENTFFNIEKDAFKGLTVDRRYFQEAGKEDLIFENNTLENFERGSLTFNTSAFTPRLDWIMIRQKCSCEEAAWWVTDLIYFLSDSSTNSGPFQVSSLMFCLSPVNKRVKDFQNFSCNVTKSSLVIIVIVISCVILVVLAVVGLWYYRARTKGKRYINVPASSRVLRPAEPNKGHMLVVPEGRTYRETELQVIVEHAEQIVPFTTTEFVKERPDRNGND